MLFFWERFVFFISCSWYRCVQTRIACLNPFLYWNTDLFLQWSVGQYLNCELDCKALEVLFLLQGHCLFTFSSKYQLKIPVYLKSKERNKAVELPDRNKRIFHFNQTLLVYILIWEGISPAQQHWSGMLFNWEVKLRSVTFWNGGRDCLIQWKAGERNNREGKTWNVFVFAVKFSCDNWLKIGEWLPTAVLHIQDFSIL